MPAVTQDGRSFLIDGRRVWLVSGRVPYARVPRDAWADRIQSAKNAGLNTIETPVIWARHEQRAGKFDFSGENDLRHFVDLVGKAGMYCILGLGPYVGAEWDMGGLPAYLCEKEGTALRTTNQKFLEASSRFINAVADQIRGWQVTAPGTGGPIVLLECESEWTCGLETLANSYLGELTRYIRESGLSVPIVNSNNLWQSVEGQIDCWSGSEEMLATVRQLGAVRSGQPRIVINFTASQPDCWGMQPRPVLSAREFERRMAEVLVGGGQCNIATFCGGTNFGFSGGRLHEGPATFSTHGADRGCVIDQTGAATELFPALRRVATFASRFGRVFASLEPAYQPVTLKPSAHQAPKAGRGSRHAGVEPSVVHAAGNQGGAAFIFLPDGEKPARRSAEARTITLLLSDGTELPVPLGSYPVVWCLLDANVSPKCHLDYSNLSALGATGALLAVHGPAGARAVLSVNGSPVEASVPTDAEPTVLAHEGLTIVIVRDQDVDLVTFADDAVLFGVTGLTAAGLPILPPGARQYVRIGSDGKARPVLLEHRAGRGHHKAEKIALEEWAFADQEDYLTGQSARYASIESVAELAALGAPHGYGWYRFVMDVTRPRTTLLDCGLGGDRLHLFLNGRHTSLLGHGPGAHAQAEMTLARGPQTLIVLAENLGRFSGGANLGEAKGLIGDIFEVHEARIARPELTRVAPVPLLPFRTPLWDVSEGDTTTADRLVWKFKGHKGRLMMRIPHPPASGIVLLNDTPIAYLDRSGPTCLFLPEDKLSRGNNELHLAVLTADPARDVLAHAGRGVTFFDVVGGLSESSELAFARWEMPSAGSFHPDRPGAEHAHVPGWWRCRFEAVQREKPMLFEPVGMTKGQFYVNGRHAGRYFVATREGRSVPPQERYFVPGSWLKADQLNELTIFDEHGASPARCRIVQ